MSRGHEHRRHRVLVLGRHARSALAPARLPEHETAFALTVHKSQGSEFQDVLMVLPDAPSQVLTRELLYTAITRTRNTVTILASAEVFSNAVERCITRFSGLRDRLKQGLLAHSLCGPDISP